MGKLTAHCVLYHPPYIFDTEDRIGLEVCLYDGALPVGIFGTMRPVHTTNPPHQPTASEAASLVLELFQSALNDILDFAERYGIDGEAAIDKDKVWPPKSSLS